MDEPTTFLDASCQYEMLDMIKEFRDKGKCVVVELHDIAQAVRVADRLILLADGEKAFYGTPHKLFESRILEEQMKIIPHKTVYNGKDIFYFTKKE